jgi:hypothetical protein
VLEGCRSTGKFRSAKAAADYEELSRVSGVPDFKNLRNLLSLEQVSLPGWRLNGMR